MSQDMWLYYFTLAVTIAIYIFSVKSLEVAFGRAFMAIRETEIAASAMGIDVALYKTLAFGRQRRHHGWPALGADRREFVAPDGYTITLADSLFSACGRGVGGCPDRSRLGLHYFRANIAEWISGRRY